MHILITPYIANLKILVYNHNLHNNVKIYYAAIAS